MSPIMSTPTDKIAAVKAHYTSIANGKSPIVGSTLATPVRVKTVAAPPPVEKKHDSKRWVVVNNRARPYKLKSYYDPEDREVPQNLLCRFDEKWSDM